MEHGLTIGRVARCSGANIQTVRYYERRGLLSPAGRTESGYRLYGPEAARIIRFIRNAQELGFALREIAELLRLRVDRKGQCAKIRKQASAKLETVREKIASLRGMEKALGRLIRTCSAQGTTESCPILNSLEEKTDEAKNSTALF
ncbi:MAG TPA: MerR family transcriptional regulator [Elusimicrobiota bacterium]|nr:MerR family transcriptional regulator [Elusimicrobiota bacterium]